MSVLIILSTTGEKPNFTIYIELLVIFFLLAIYATFKALRTSDDCERSNPNLALFKYDKNKPQRLSYLADVDVNTGKRAEWCIRTYLDGSIQVHPVCNTTLPTRETIFHEYF